MPRANHSIDRQAIEGSGSNKVPSLKAFAKSQATNTEYRFDDYANLPVTLFKPESDSAQHYIDYMKDIDRAYFDLKHGKYADAAKAFATIGTETLFELPNDATWAGHAESLCRNDKKAEGRRKLSSAKCSLGLLSNSQTCTDLDEQKSSASFPSDCYREYCEAEILRPDYDQENPAPNPADISAKLADYNLYLDTISRLCQ